MILLIAVAAATLVACEIALRLPLARTLARLSGAARKAVAVVRSPGISDTWKERSLPAYAGRIMTASVVLFGCLLAIAVPVLAAAALATGSLAAGAAALMRPLVLLEMLVLGIGYVWLRTRAAP